MGEACSKHDTDLGNHHHDDSDAFPPDDEDDDLAVGNSLSFELPKPFEAKVYNFSDATALTH